MVQMNTYMVVGDFTLDKAWDKIKTIDIEKLEYTKILIDAQGSI